MIIGDEDKYDSRLHFLCETARHTEVRGETEEAMALKKKVIVLIT